MSTVIHATFHVACWLIWLLGEVFIPVNCRVPNPPPGYCAWSSIETLGNHLRIKQLYGLVESRKKDPDTVTGAWKLSLEYGLYYETEVIEKNAGTCDTIKEKLDGLGVRYVMQRDGGTDTRLITDSINRNLGCVVGVWSGLPTCRGHHAIIVIDFNEKTYCYIDTNDCLSIYVGSRSWFDAYWDGFILVVCPK